MNFKGNIQAFENLKEKMWTEGRENEKRTLQGLTCLPIGLQEAICPKCGSMKLSGALITPTADEQDPNIICCDCGYWWD